MNMVVLILIDGGSVAILAFMYKMKQGFSPGSSCFCLVDALDFGQCTVQQDRGFNEGHVFYGTLGSQSNTIFLVLLDIADYFYENENGLLGSYPKGDDPTLKYMQECSKIEIRRLKLI